MVVFSGVIPASQEASGFRLGGTDTAIAYPDLDGHYDPEFAWFIGLTVTFPTLQIPISHCRR